MENINKFVAQGSPNLTVSYRSASLATNTQNGFLLPFLSPSQGHGTLLTHTNVSFFGPRTLLGSLRALFQRMPDYKIPGALKQAASIRRSLQFDIQSPRVDLPSSTISSLLHLFSTSAHAFFPILDETTLETMIASVYDMESYFTQDDHGILYLVLAIASSVVKRSEPTFAYWAPLFFKQAIEKATIVSNHSRSDNIALFQRTLLICVYLLLNPEAGDIWRNLGFAIRLFLDLSHRPSDDEVEDHHLFCMLTRSLYCLERYVYPQSKVPGLTSL